MHDTMVIAIPALAVLFGIFLNRFDFSRLQSRMEKRFDALEGKVASKVQDLGREIRDLRKEMQQEFREFYRSSVQQDARIDKLENKQS